MKFKASSKFLRILKESLEITSAEIADSTGISVQELETIEKGEIKINSSQMKELCKLGEIPTGIGDAFIVEKEHTSSSTEETLRKLFQYAKKEKSTS